MAMKMKKRLSRKKWESIERVRWALGIPSSPGSYRGLKAEETVLESLKYHQKKKTVFPDDRRIIEIVPTLHFGQDDLKGKDIIVKFQTHEVLPIQVRNWWRIDSVVEFRRRGICLIVVRLFDQDGKAKSLEEIKQETRERTYREIKRYLDSYGTGYIE